MRLRRTDERDIIAYMWALFWLGRCFYNGRIRLFDAIGFLVLYVIYVIFVFLQDKFFIEEPEIGEIYEICKTCMTDWVKIGVRLH